MIWAALTAAEASHYRRKANRMLLRAIALQVRDDHANGRLCHECPEPKSGLRCPRLATWMPILDELEQP
jgi:hypothetical protein